MINYDKNNNIQPDIKDIYRTVNSLELPVYIFNPKVQNDKNKYIVICIHGGGWTTGIKADSEWNGGDMIHQAKIFSQLGFFGVAISYRNITNPDTDITDLINDCKQAVYYIKNKLNVDNKHIILLGDSAGAHLATCLGISNDDSVRPEIVIACNPVLDCVNKFSYASNNEEIRRQVSPLFTEIKKSSKFLFIHGDKDTTTPIENTIAMNERLKNLGFNSELIVLKDVMHAFILYNYRSTDEDVEKYMEIIIEFLNKQLS